MTKIYLITGFLGAGKTTFLQERLKNTKAKVGVLMNEFGKISMDTITLKSNDIDLLELKNGSIFCACLKDKFIDGLETLITMDLDEVYIEGSGLADPSDMGKVVEILTKKLGEDRFTFKGTLCIVDGVFFKEELKKMVSVERQILHSHHVLINKIDLIDENKLSDIKETIHSLNPKAKISTMEKGIIDWEKISFDYYPIEDEETTNTKDNKPKNVVISFKNEPELEQLNGFLTSVHEYFYRIKGFIKIKDIWLKVDMVNDKIDIQPYTQDIEDEEADGYNELVCLSSQGLLSISHLAKMAEKYLGMLYTLEI